MPQEAQRGSRGINLLILNLTARWGGQSMTCSSHFIPREEPQYPLLRRLGERMGWPEWVERTENLLVPPGLKPWIIQPGTSHYTDFILAPRDLIGEK
jgi:hypothetical protein